MPSAPSTATWSWRLPDRQIRRGPREARGEAWRRLIRRRNFLVCWGLAIAFQLAATFTDGDAGTVFGALAIVFIALGFLFVAAWMIKDTEH